MLVGKQRNLDFKFLSALQTKNMIKEDIGMYL